MIQESLRTFNKFKCSRCVQQEQHVYSWIWNKSIFHVIHFEIKLKCTLYSIWIDQLKGHSCRQTHIHISKATKLKKSYTLHTYIHIYIYIYRAIVKDINWVFEYFISRELNISFKIETYYWIFIKILENIYMCGRRVTL